MPQLGPVKDQTSPTEALEPTKVRTNGNHHGTTDGKRAWCRDGLEPKLLKSTGGVQWLMVIKFSPQVQVEHVTASDVKPCFCQCGFQFELHPSQPFFALMVHHGLHPQPKHNGT